MCQGVVLQKSRLFLVLSPTQLFGSKWTHFANLLDGTAASSNVSKDDIMKWFDNIEKYLKKEGLYDILADPDRVFDGDETGFQLCPKTKTVLAAKGARMCL